LYWTRQQSAEQHVTSERTATEAVGLGKHNESGERFEYRQSDDVLRGESVGANEGAIS